MDRVEVLVDDVIEAYRDKRMRLWLANLTDVPDDFGQWSGVVWVGAETYLYDWLPSRDQLLERLRKRMGSNGTGIGADAVAEEAVHLAREAFAVDLLSRHVPGKVVERAKGVLLPRPPIQQWKMQ